MKTAVPNRVWKGLLFLNCWLVIAILVSPALFILWKGAHVYWDTLVIKEGLVSAFLSLQYADEFLSGLKQGALYSLGGASLVAISCIVIVLSRTLSDTVEYEYISWFFAYFALLAILIPPWSVALSVEQLKMLLTSIGGLPAMFADSEAYTILIVSIFAMPFGLYFYMLRMKGEDEQLIIGLRETGSRMSRFYRVVNFVYSLRHIYIPASIAAFFTASLVILGDGGRTVRILRKDESIARFFEEVFRSASDEGLWVFAAIVVCISMLCLSAAGYFHERREPKR